LIIELTPNPSLKKRGVFKIALLFSDSTPLDNKFVKKVPLFQEIGVSSNEKL